MRQNSPPPLPPSLSPYPSQGLNGGSPAGPRSFGWASVTVTCHAPCLVRAPHPARCPKLQVGPWLSRARPSPTPRRRAPFISPLSVPPPMPVGPGGLAAGTGEVTLPDSEVKLSAGSRPSSFRLWAAADAGSCSGNFLRIFKLVRYRNAISESACQCDGRNLESNT